MAPADESKNGKKTRFCIVWPDLCRGNIEKRYTEAKKESLSSETWT